MKSARTLSSVLLLLLLINVMAQEKIIRLPGQQALPEHYFALNDYDKMRFLVQAIQDSLNEDQLTHTLDWSRAGYEMAIRYNIDTLKGIFLFDIAKAFAYWNEEYDSAIVYYKRALPYFPNKMNKYHLLSLRELMELYSERGERDSTFRYLNSLTEIMSLMPDSLPRKVSLSQNIATVYQYFGMYRTAIRYFQFAIMGQRKNKNYRGLGLALANLGLLYNEMGDDGKAIQFSKEALIYLADVNRPYIETASNVAEFYIGVGQYDSAQKYIDLSDRVLQRTRDENTIASNQAIMSVILAHRGKLRDAEQLIQNAIRTILSSDDEFMLCRAYIDYVAIDTLRYRFDDALVHLNKALEISKRRQFPLISVAALQCMNRVSVRLGDYKNAWKYQSESNALKDSLVSNRSKEDLNELEISYQTLQKEQKIQVLTSENSLKNLELQNTRRAQLFYIIASLAVVAALVVYLYQRNLRAKIQTGKLKAELQTQVLRSQMNPHFIFNSLNSIENFIMQNNKRQASDYLSKFSTLMRSILDSSMNELVSITKDMDALRLYVELEQLRFNNKFRFNLHVDVALSNGDYRVPSLLIQPYVENAILHGLAPSEEPSLCLTVMASLENDNIKYTIMDNGIGIEKSKSYNAHNKPGHKSVGMKITEERIHMFNGRYDQNAITITGLNLENKNGTGTKVEINIKTA